MRKITTNYDNLYDLIPEGAYEVIVSKAEYFTLPSSGKEIFAVSVTIRNDIEQACQNRFIDSSIYSLDSDKAIGFLTNSISKAIGFPAGSEFESLEAWGAAILYKPLVVIVKHQEYNGNVNARIRYFSPTAHAIVQHKFPEQAKSMGAPQSYAAPSQPAPTYATTVSDEDLPF